MPAPAPAATMEAMRRDRLRFALSAERRVPPAVVVLLALPAIGQALQYSVAIVRSQAQARPALANADIFLTALPLCLLAAATTVPLLLRSAAWAAIATSLATMVMLVGFQRATVTGVLAVILAVYRLGATPVPASASAAQRMGPYVAVGLALPFLVMALASQSVPEVILAAGVPAAAGTGIAVRARQSATGEDEARSVLSYALTEHMARGERARIARELHDVVAHHISMIAVLSETTRLTTPGMPEAGATRLREIGDTARAGLTEMRRLLGVLREDVAADEVGERQPQPGLPQVAALVDVARDAAMSGVGSGAVRLIVSGTVTSYDPGTELAAYRIVQEALTNARRHAPGAAVDVELMYSGAALRLRIRDNGPGPAQGSAVAEGTSGHGLLGMRERAATVGGWVQTGAAAGGGFLVEALLPAKPDELMTSTEAVR
jgi:signal transduction histidine kinase